jgi:hypothetical protein
MFFIGSKQRYELATLKHWLNLEITWSLSPVELAFRWLFSLSLV